MKVKIDKPRDIIIIEKSNCNHIDKGTRFYCGCCGESLGISKINLSFPISVNFFISNLDDKTFTFNKIGLRHITCKHTMFSFRKGFDFITLNNYLKEIRKI